MMHHAMFFCTLAVVAAQTIDDFLDVIGGGSDPEDISSFQTSMVRLSTSAVTSVPINSATVEEVPGGNAYSGVSGDLLNGTASFINNAAGSEELVLECVDLDRPCVFVVALLTCTPCSVAFNGGLPAELLDAGFEAGSCGPRYHRQGSTWSTTVFRMIFAPTQTVRLALSRDLQHAVVFHKTLFGNCANRCEPSYCAGDGSSCAYKPLCPPKPHGPSYGSGDVCVCPH